MKQFIEKFHAAAINRIIEAMRANPSQSEHWDSGSRLSECYGWDGVMSPITRAAFVEDYGEEITAQLEKEARAKLAEMESIANEGKFADHEREAERNAVKPVAEWRVGDFVMATRNGLKFDGNVREWLLDLVDGEIADRNERDRDYIRVTRRLCKIVRIEEKGADFFNDPLALLHWKPQENEGGCASDDVPDGWNVSEEKDKLLRDAYIATYYSLCVLVRSSSGEYVLIDPEGYDYARYILAPQDYRVVFAPVIEQALADREIKRKEREEAERKEREERERAAERKMAEAVARATEGVKVSENKEKHGIEIRFAKKPPQFVLNLIKARHCWRWSKFAKCWYAKFSENEWQFAQSLAVSAM